IMIWPVFITVISGHDKSQPPGCLLESWHGTLTGFKVENGLDGNVSERGDGYEMVIRGLSVDQLIKVAGFIKQL
ncbi:hypothetical protein ACN6OE_25600, partial [Escherichia coli]